jgi:hypothetical protein
MLHFLFIVYLSAPPRPPLPRRLHGLRTSGPPLFKVSVTSSTSVSGPPPLDALSNLPRHHGNARLNRANSHRTRGPHNSPVKHCPAYHQKAAVSASRDMPMSLLLKHMLKMITIICSRGRVMARGDGQADSRGRARRSVRRRHVCRIIVFILDISFLTEQ